MIHPNFKKVLGRSGRERKIMVVGRQDYTSPRSFQNLPLYGVPA